MECYITRVYVAREVFFDEEIRDLVRHEYGWHQLVWKLFPEQQASRARRAFVYRVDMVGGTPVLHVVSDWQPQDGGLTGIRLETKPYDPRPPEGSRLKFELRLNPTVSRKQPGVPGGVRGAVHDVVVDALKATPKGERALPEALRAHDAVIAWLQDRQERLGCTFREQTLLVSRYERHQFTKPAGGRAVRYSTVDVEGELIVNDVDALHTALTSGVGRAKAWGCGLLLVRRA